MAPKHARVGSGSAPMLGFVFLDLAQQVGSALQCLSQFDAGATLPLFDCCDPVRRGNQVRHEALFDIALRLHTLSTGRSLDWSADLAGDPSPGANRPHGNGRQEIALSLRGKIRNSVADTDPFVQSLPNCVKSCIGPVVLPLQACTGCTLHDPPMCLFKRWANTMPKASGALFLNGAPHQSGQGSDERRRVIEARRHTVVFNA
jgi:hypothetical protein